jgi:precorrin-6Y C5,15-methyltransferase (decarboxylating)
MTEPKVYVIGLSNPDDLSLEAQNILVKAKVLAGPPRLLDFFPDFLGSIIPLKGDLNSWFQVIAALAQKDPTVVLASGDPTFYGLAEKLLTVIDPNKVKILPGLTMVQRAFSLLKMSWDKVETVSVHGRENFREFWAAIYRLGQRGGRLAVYTDPVNGPAKIASLLLAKGLDNLTMTVFEDLATPYEKMTALTLSQAEKNQFSPLNLVVLTANPPAQTVILGAPEETYQPENGLITKAEVRVVALGLLRLQGDETFWDLGSGCGSVAVESARLLSRGEIIALEKDPTRVELILANRRRFGLAHLEVVAGEAPAALSQLPAPDRVFVGGGGAALETILKATLKRLKPHGIVVCAAINIESLTTATHALAALSPPEVVQVSLFRSQPLGDGRYLKALNPVWLVKSKAA